MVHSSERTGAHPREGAGRNRRDAFRAGAGTQPPRLDGCRAAVVVHRGGYGGIAVAHAALHRWCSDKGETIGHCSWEIYGDHDEDPSKLETTIFYLLA